MICVWSLALAPAVRMASGTPWLSTVLSGKIWVIDAFVGL
jgi:hypothetical protein